MPQLCWAMLACPLHWPLASCFHWASTGQAVSLQVMDGAIGFWGSLQNLLSAIWLSCMQSALTASIPQLCPQIFPPSYLWPIRTIKLNQCPLQLGHFDRIPIMLIFLQHNFMITNHWPCILGYIQSNTWHHILTHTDSYSPYNTIFNILILASLLCYMFIALSGLHWKTCILTLYKPVNPLQVTFTSCELMA